MANKKYSQNEYNRRWANKNKEYRRYLSYRSTSKTFIRNYAKLEDLEELRELINDKEKDLKKRLL